MASLQELASVIRPCREIVFFTGAGISTESGVPDFRSPGGIWTRYQPIYFSEFLESEKARLEYWKRKEESYELYRKTKPNLGHYSIRAFEDRGQLLGLITQNIDGLHQLAGVSEDKVIELHGNDRKVVCLQCDQDVDGERVYASLKGLVRSPRCNDCGGYLKPATISFGQPMPVEAMRRAQALSTKAKIFIVVGTSLQVHPAASFPVLAKQSGAFLAIVNREPTPLDDIANFHFHGGIGEFFQQFNPLLGDG